MFLHLKVLRYFPNTHICSNDILAMFRILKIHTLKKFKNKNILVMSTAHSFTKVKLRVFICQINL